MKLLPLSYTQVPLSPYPEIQLEGLRLRNDESSINKAEHISFRFLDSNQVWKKQMVFLFIVSIIQNTSQLLPDGLNFQGQNDFSVRGLTERQMTERQLAG